VGARRSSAAGAPRWCVIGHEGAGPAGRVELVELAADGTPLTRDACEPGRLPEHVRERESAAGAAGAAVRWVWSDTSFWYPMLLAAGVSVERCHDLRLCHAILKRSERVPDRQTLAAEPRWDAGPDRSEQPRRESPALFEIEAAGSRAGGVPHDVESGLAEFARQSEALAGAADSGRIGLLLAGESAGALVAAEMTSAGMPWDVAEHDRLLRESLGPRPSGDAKPEKLLALADEVRAALGYPDASLDSQPKLLRALRRAGIEVSSTSQWELREFEHPAIDLLLRYKKLSRLVSANGWAWIDEWVRDGRYRPAYVPGGVVTGRWGSSGGGALQLPRQLRSAVRADPGWALVSADVAQLEPRVLAAMAGDRAMAVAAAGKDLYAGIVASGLVSTRQEAKIALLGAMYGSTTGDSGRLVPRLRHGFTAAMRLVDDAAAIGEQGGRVTSWLGRSSPEPGAGWHELQSRASLPAATRADEDRARRAAREFGRFTRNFVVQATAAEWALAWLAGLRRRLAKLDPLRGGEIAAASGPVFERRPHPVFFLHDEVIVHTPREQAEAVAAAVEEAATAAGRLLFGDAPIDFPLELRIAERAEKG